MKRIFRRDFLKYSAAGASVLAVNHYMGDVFASTTAKDNPYVNRNTGKRIHGKPTFCTGCGAGCGIIAYVHDGELMKLKGNPAHPVNRGKLCVIGEAGYYSYYDPERLTRPMVRTGKRGEGRFKEVSWAKAEEVVAARLKESGKGVVIEAAGPNVGEPANDLARKLGGKVVILPRTSSESRERALMASAGAPYDIPDVSNTEYVLNFGANPLVASHAGVLISGELADRLAGGGLRLVTLDPRLSETAGRSNLWLPLIPGTDGFVALAMANVIMEEGLYDKAFIQNHTDTSVADLKAHLKEFTPDAAERISTVKASDITKVAREYAGASRAVVITGGGVTGHPHGLNAERAIWLLAAITGKLGRKGCNIIPEGALPPKSDMTARDLHVGMITGEHTPGAYMVVGADPAYSSPENELLRRVLADESKVPFIVAMDTHISDTGLYADVVLPMTTYLEEHSCRLTHAPDGTRVIDYAKPVARAIGESRQFADVVAALLSRAGKSPKYTGGLQAADDVALGLLGTKGARGLSELDSAGFISFGGHAHGHVAERTRFDTPSGMVELNNKEMGGLPSLSAKDVYKGWKDVELALVTFSPVGYREGFTENNLLTKEMNHSTRAFINSETGKRMGLRNRDVVEIKSKAGAISIPVMLSPGVHPNVVAVAEGCGHEGYGNIEKGERYRGTDPFTHAIWWGHDGHGENPNKVKPLVAGDEAEAGALVTKVIIRKA